MAPKKKRDASPSAAPSNKKRRATTTTTNNAAASGAPLTGTAPPTPAPPVPAPAPAPSAATAPTGSVPGNVAFGAESDPIVRTFGNLGEGSQLLGPNDTERRNLLEQRYNARRRLADMAARPDGYEFTHHIYGSDPQTVILVSPPYMVAEPAPNGGWQRRARVVATDGPLPCTTQWYNQWLRENNLPSWFLSLGHLEILTVPQETDNLGIAHDTTTPTTSDHYLEIRYPEQPQLPQAVSHGNAPFIYQLSEDEQPRLARMFPAINFLGNDRRIIVHPRGHITVHHDPSSLQLPQISAELVAWIVNTTGVASYRVQQGNLPPLRHVLLNSDQHKTRAKKSRIVLDPKYQCQCNGSFDYATKFDERNAEILDFTGADHAARAIEHDALRRGLPQGSTPPVVVDWYPDLANANLVDPPYQPAGPGHWHYTSPESQEFAELQFGDQGWAGIHLLGNHHPTAADIWLVRENYARLNADGANLADPTVEVNIVWVPDATNTNNGEVIMLSDDELEDAAPVARREVDLGFGIDPVTGLAHDPKNDGIEGHDQTAHDGRGQYQTRMVGKKNFIKKITLDVARARPTVDPQGNPNGNVPQKHRTFIYCKGGRWERWDKSLDLEAPGGWDDRKLVEKLNRWAEQTRIRQGWRPKRVGAREKYTSDEKKWVWDEHNDKKRSYKDIAKDFNKVFDLKGALKRDGSGISSLISRLKQHEAKWAAGNKKADGMGGKTATKDSKADEGGKVEEDGDGGMAVDTVQDGQAEHDGQDGQDGDGGNSGHEHGDDSDVDAPHELDDEA